LSWSWVLCKWLRSLGCRLPIMVAYMGTKEMPSWAVPMFEQLGATPWDAFEAIKKHPVKALSGWTLKNYAITHCPWQHVLFLDADCFPSVKPEELLSIPEVRESGGLFFSDIANHCKHNWGYVYSGTPIPAKEWEAGIYVINKKTGWLGLRWANWLNEHTNVWFNLGHGDKYTLYLGFKISKVPHIASQECEWGGWGISQQWQGKEWARHAMAFKRGESGPPFPEIATLFFEWGALTLGKL